MNVLPAKIKAIIGLGNPGRRYYNTRHSIGFRIVDCIAHRFEGIWKAKDFMEIAKVTINNDKVLLIKPLTFMNASGKVIPYLLKNGIKPENILVIHDELELAPGKIKLRFGGSARGHNGLRSIMDIIGKEFARLSFGIGRPERREDVSSYVLSNFNEDIEMLDQSIEHAINMISDLFSF